MVSIVIVNWNGGSDLQRCLQAIGSQIYARREVIVVDNSSTDGSPEMAKRAFPDVQLLYAGDNLGFAAGCNCGIRAASGEYVATLNTDAWPEEDWLAELVRAMESEPAIGMVASKMLFADQPHIINSAGIAMDVLGIAWDRLGGVPDRGDDSPCEVFGPCAGAALYRRSLLEEVGLFDEDFFMYLEDVDLAWRARALGWRCFYASSARVLHRHAGSIGRNSPLQAYLLGRNKIWNLVKNCPTRHLWSYGGLMLFYDLLSVGLSVSRGSFASLRGRLAALLGIRRMLAKRRTSPASRAQGQSLRPLLVGIESPRRVAARYQHLAQLSGASRSGSELSSKGRDGLRAL